jgi:hypothetical protein
VRWDKISMKVGIKILSKHLSNTEQLTASLRTLLLAAEQGEWDRITDLSGQLLLELEFAGKPDFLSNMPSVDRKEIDKILLLLISAIEQCTTRMDQIAPLLNALKVTQETAGAP